MAILPAYQDIWHRVVSFTSLCAGAADGLQIHNVVPKNIQAQYNIIGKRVLLTDFAGRDSIAACMEILRDESVDTVIPVGDTVPSRYGDSDSYSNNWDYLAYLMERNHPSVDLKPWFLIDGQEFWKTLNERYVDDITEKYGWFTPCIGCHFHFYAMRSILVRILGHDTILVSGEKKLHSNGKRKANQTDAAVSAYSQFSSAQGVDHRFPIHHFESEGQIVSLIGERWEEGRSQMSCIHSGNDRDNLGRLKYTDKQISEMMIDYILPMGRKYIDLKSDVKNEDDYWSALDTFSDNLLQ